MLCNVEGCGLVMLHRSPDTATRRHRNPDTRTVRPEALASEFLVVLD